MKPIFFSQIAKTLVVVDQWLTTSSLVIQYVYNGNDYTIDLDQLDAMDLLKKYGIIEDHHSMMVKLVDEDGRTVWVEWQDFALNYNLDEATAKIIACSEEESKPINAWANEDVRPIPDLIKKNVHPIFQGILDSVFPNPTNRLR